jgi:TPP-dependent indolepyruvate ferredoxin oxidoreductase alpha subunit
MTEWSHLPNARHIDQALINMKLFSIRPMPAHDAAWRASWDVARDAAWGAAQAASRDVVWDAAWDAAWNVAWDVAWHGAWRSVQDAIMALVAYDHSDRYMNMTADQLRAWSALGTDPAAILLLPYVTLLEHSTTEQPV